MMRPAGIAILLVVLAGGSQLSAQDDEERFASANIGYHSSKDGATSMVLGGGYYIKIIKRVLLSADVGVKFLEKPILGIPGNEVTWVDISANARYLLAEASPVTPFIGLGVGYGPVSVNDSKLKTYGVTLEGSTSAFAFIGMAGLRFETESNICLHFEARYMTAGFPIEGAIKETVDLDGFEVVGGLQLRL